MVSPQLIVHAPAVPPVRIVQLAFFTLGDRRPAGSPADLRLTVEEMWRRRAELLAPGHAHGVQNLDEAIEVLEALEPNVVLDKVFFLGHGSGDDFGFFFFSGRPDPDLNFAADHDDQVLEISRAEMKSTAFGRNKEFVIKLARSLARAHPAVDEVEIAFLACFMGQGETHEAVCDFLRNWLVGPREVRFKVGAFENFYETVFVTDGHGTLTHWEDHIVVEPGGAEVIPNPGPDGIPPYEVGCNGRMVRTPLLFSVFTVPFQGELEAGTFSDQFRQEFSLSGHRLSPTVRIVAQAADRWMIVDEERSINYRVVTEDGELKVYQP